MRFIITALLLLAQCSAPTKLPGPQTLDNFPATYKGRFTDDYGIMYNISDTVWIQEPGIKYHLLKYDSAGHFFIARNGAANPSEAGLYSRIDVIHFTGMEPWGWGFCLTEYKAKTVEEAIATQAADRANPRKGCNGYPFSRMKRVEEKQ